MSVDQRTVVGVEGPAGTWARLDPTLNGIALEIANAAETDAGSSIHMLAKAVNPSPEHGQLVTASHQPV